MLRILALVAVLVAAAAPASAAMYNLASFGNSTEQVTFNLTQPAVVEILLTSFSNVTVTAGDFSFSSAGPLPASTFAGINVGPGDVTLSLTGFVSAASFNVSEVPLPGALLLLGSGIAGLAYMRRRRADA